MRGRHGEAKPPGTLVTPTVTFHVQPAGPSWSGTKITFEAGSIVHFTTAGSASATCPLNNRTLSATRVGDFPPPAGPYFSVSDPTPVVEPDKGAVKLTFTVTLVNPPPTGTASVRYETSDEFARAKKDKVTGDKADYSHKKGKLKFKAGTTVRTFTVTVKGDATESDETLLVTFTEPVGAVIYGDGIVRGTILNGSD
jgi:Calx-beta domain-containing protein